MKKSKKPTTTTTTTQDKKLSLLKEVVRDHLASVNGGWGGCGGSCDTTLNSCCPN